MLQVSVREYQRHRALSQIFGIQESMDQAKKSGKSSAQWHPSNQENCSWIVGISDTS